MKKTFIFTLLLLAGLFTLASCTESFPKGKDVRFTATSSNNTATRVSYSGDVQNGRERIDWTESDVIRIYSSSADVVNGYGYRYADYNLVDIQTSEEKSTAKLQNIDPEVRGLFWEDDAAAAAATFYGMNIMAEPQDNVSPQSGVFKGLSISGAPDITWNVDASGNTVGTPNVNEAYLLSKPAKISSNKVSLDFYPVYSAFDITLKSQETEITVNSIELLSETTKIAGRYSFDANYLADGQNPKNGFIQTTTESGASLSRIVVTFPVNTKISTTKSVRFTVFALPRDISGLSIKVNFGENKSRTLALKKNDAFITFPAFHKANITGLALKDEWNFFVDLGLSVLPWTVSGDHTIDFANSVMTTAFVFSSSEYVNTDVVHSEADWTNIFQVSEDAALYITFKISNPIGANWSVQSVDPSGYFTVEKMVDGVASDPVGTVDDKTITLRIKPNVSAIPAERTSAYNMILHTFVTVGENIYNIDSETQNFDRYNSYATFTIPANL